MTSPVPISTYTVDVHYPLQLWLDPQGQLQTAHLILPNRTVALVEHGQRTTAVTDAPPHDRVHVYVQDAEELATNVGLRRIVNAEAQRTRVFQW